MTKFLLLLPLPKVIAGSEPMPAALLRQAVF
jgi:hypothetical protein